MANEIELKLSLAEHDQSRFLRHPLLRTAASRKTETLDNVYFDTPDLSLRRHGVALRTRRQGRRWLQTIKLAGKASAGLSSRPEWETPYSGQFDFSPVEVTPMREWLQRPQLLERIIPICETGFRRITWRFPFGDGAVLLTLDRGWIVANGQREAISELELELDGAPVSAIFSIAQQLAQRVALAPSVFSKAERGYRLHAGTVTTPFKATEIPLDATMAPVATLRVIALSCLQHLQQNHPGALTSDDPEYIHQQRVATRRLRAALRLFAPVLPEHFSTPLNAGLATLTTDLGRARDMDVLLTDIVDPVQQALPDEPRLAALTSEITNARHRARQHAVGVLAAPEYGQLLLAALETFERVNLADNHVTSNDPAGAGPARDSQSSRARPAPTEPLNQLSTFATERLRRLRNKVRRLALAASTDNPLSLHALRISIKRLRYALEFFSPLLNARATKRILKRLTKLQDVLGQLNDLASAGALLMDCAGDNARLREAVTLIGGWHGKRYHRLLRGIPPELKHLKRLQLPALNASR